MARKASVYSGLQGQPAQGPEAALAFQAAGAASHWAAHWQPIVRPILSHLQILASALQPCTWVTYFTQHTSNATRFNPHAQDRNQQSTLCKQ